MTTATMMPKAQHASATPHTIPWGTSVSIDCYQCDPEWIRCPERVKAFTKALVDLIEMKAFGPCHVVHFGEDERVAGLSMFQLIETSCISAHFANATNTAYIDVFSCKPFDAELAAEFCVKYFKADRSVVKANKRW